MAGENTQILLGGDVYIDRFDATGNPTGLIGPLNTGKLLVKMEVEEKVQPSQMKADFGQARATVNIPKPSVISVEFRDQPPEIIAMALLGSPDTLSEALASVTDEAITAVLGRWVDLPNRSITAGTVVVTDSPMTETYVEGTDYEINYVTGLLRAIAGGGIADSDALLVDYDSVAVSGVTIAGGSQSQITARIILDGVNLVTGKAVHFEAHKATLRPESDIDLNSGEFISSDLTGNMQTPPGKTSPFVLETLD
jgi:hypothetical protein